MKVEIHLFYWEQLWPVASMILTHSKFVSKLVLDILFIEIFKKLFKKFKKIF